MLNFIKSNNNINLSKKEVWDSLEISFKNQDLQEFEKIILENKEYFNSKDFRSDIVEILNNEGKFYNTKFIGALLFKISENSNKSVNSIKNYIQNELGNLFKEKNNTNLEELIKNIKIKLKEKDKNYIYQIKEFSQKIVNLEKKIQNIKENEVKLKKENRILKKISEDFSEIFKILIENDFLVGDSPISSVQKIVKDYKVMKSFISYLKKEEVLIETSSKGLGISPKIKSELKSNKLVNKEFKIDIKYNDTIEESSSIIKKEEYEIKKYEFQEIEKDKSETSNLEKNDNEAYMDVYGDFMVHMEDMKIKSEQQNKEIEELKQNNIEKDKLLSDIKIQNLEKDLEIEKLKQEIEILKKGKGTKHSKHKLNKAKKAYEENS